MSNTISSTTSSPTSDPNRWPPQIKYIVGNEAAERFSYYGMKSILALYITTALVQSKDRATTIMHLFGFANYFMPLFGAWVSDRFWGRYHTIFWISLFYCAGHGVLAMSDLFGSVDARLWCLYVGLGLIAFGSGGIKPCVSAFMGDQFSADQAHLMRKAYGAFYFSINFGSFFSFLVIPWIAKKSGYGWAFGVPGILMAVATLIFWLGTKHYVRVPPARQSKQAGFVKVFLTAFRNLAPGNGGVRFSAWTSVLTTLVLPALVMIGMVYVAFHQEMNAVLRSIAWASVGCVILWYALVILMALTGRINLPEAFWNGARARFSAADIAAARSVAPILAVFAFVPAFWALFEQSNSTWVLQGAQMRPFTLLGLEIGAEQMQSLNPLLVMALVPALTWGLYPLMERFHFRVTPLRRIALGLILTAVSYLCVAWLQQRIEAKESLSLAWQAAPYIILTMAEVLVSTTGLEFAYTQAAASMKSTIMSFWLLTIAIGNLLVTTVTQLGGGHGDASVSSGRFLLYAGMTFIVAILFIVVSAGYQYRDASHSKQ
jgi:POT family proton-dependent oligopeptide transporter